MQPDDGHCFGHVECCRIMYAYIFMQHANIWCASIGVSCQNRSFRSLAHCRDVTIDREKCVVYQQITDEVLRWPANSKWKCNRLGKVS